MKASRTVPNKPLALHHATRKRFTHISATLLAWHPANKPVYAWRGLRRSPYEILVSEFMLQQTGARQIDKKLPEFLKQFPNAKRLAAAPRADVIRAWQGLGYNRRAINLQKAAQAILALRKFPRTEEELLALPGVGQYTASAILAFAFNEDVAVVDVNVQRVLSRLWKPMTDSHTVLPVSKIQELDQVILPVGQSSQWHEALMDLGSTVCTKQRPRCGECPVQSDCLSSRILHNIGHQRKQLASVEERFFGQPRRIWRGRILKIIAERDGVSSATVSRLLSQAYSSNLTDASDGTDKTEHDLLLNDILTSLREEGFITIRNSRITLADGN